MFYVYSTLQFAFAEPTVIIDANGNVFEYEDHEVSTDVKQREQLSDNSKCTESMNSISNSNYHNQTQKLHQSTSHNNPCNTSTQSQQNPQDKNRQKKTSLTVQNTNHVPTVNLDFENADIHSVIRIFAEVSGRNFILDDSVKGRVTVRLQDVPWDQALAAILLSQGLGWTSMSNPYATSLQQGTIFVVAPIGK